MSALSTLVGLMAQKSARSYATWNPADKAAAFTLSGGNLVANVNSGSACMLRSTLSKSSGKWYWEVTCNSITSYPTIGIANSSAALGNYVGANVNGLGWTNDGYIYYAGGGASPSPPTYVTSNNLGFALDASTRELIIYKNGASSGTYTSSVIPSGALFAAFGTFNGSIQQITANFGASAFTYSPPAGYNSGLYI